MAAADRPTNRSALDPLAILAALGLSDMTRITAVSGGADAALWRVETPAQAYALRVLQPAQAAQASTESVAMTAAARGGVPVPRLHAAGTWRDHPALLLTWSPGQAMAEAVMADPARGERLALAFGRTQAMIHAIPAPADFAPPIDAWIEWARPDDALRRRLRELSGGPPRLLHLDYHPLNVLVEADEVTAVLDWANAKGGDPRADLARTASILHFAPLEEIAPAGTADALRRGMIEAWRAGYRAAAGSVRDLAPFYAWAGQAMIHDLSPRLGRPDLPWLTTAYLERVQRWAEYSRRRAGL